MLQICLVLTVLGLFSHEGCVRCVRVTMRESVVVVEVGARVTLPCSYSTNPSSSFNIQWKFAAGNTLPSEGAQIYYFSSGVSYKPGSQGDRLTIAHNPPTSGDASIQLSDIRASDNGSYVCEVNNPPDFSGTGSGLVQLTVLAPPSAPSCQTSGTPRAGYDLTLRCSSSGGNPPPIYSWSFLGSKTPLQPGMMENQRTGSLIVTNLSEALSGSYRCTASNELGQTNCDLTIAVTSSSSAGAVAGAVVGVLLAVLLVAALVVYFLRYRKNQRKIPRADYGGSDIREDVTSPGIHDDSRRSARTNSRERNENVVI